MWVLALNDQPVQSARGVTLGGTHLQTNISMGYKDDQCHA